MKLFDSVLMVMVILTAGFTVITYYKVCNMYDEMESAENKSENNEGNGG